MENGTEGVGRWQRNRKCSMIASCLPSSPTPKCLVFLFLCCPTHAFKTPASDVELRPNYFQSRRAPPSQNVSATSNGRAYNSTTTTPRQLQIDAHVIKLTLTDHNGDVLTLHTPFPPRAKVHHSPSHHYLQTIPPQFLHNNSQDIRRLLLLLPLPHLLQRRRPPSAQQRASPDLLPDYRLLQP